jgi:hypothetical protein
LFWSAAVTSVLVIGYPRTIELEESYQEIANRTHLSPELQLEYALSAYSEWISCRQSTLSEQGGCKYGRVLEQRENSGGRRCISTAATSQQEEYTSSSYSRGRATSASALPHKLYYVQMHRGRRCVCVSCVCVRLFIHTNK